MPREEPLRDGAPADTPHRFIYPPTLCWPVRRTPALTRRRSPLGGTFWQASNTNPRAPGHPYTAAYPGGARLPWEQASGPPREQRPGGPPHVGRPEALRCTATYPARAEGRHKMAFPLPHGALPGEGQPPGTHRPAAPRARSPKSTSPRVPVVRAPPFGTPTTAGRMERWGGELYLDKSS